MSFAFVREKLKASYSDTGRPSIDPEPLLKFWWSYLYGIISERKLVEELPMHLAWRWFSGLGFDHEIPHHSMFSKKRQGRFQEWKLFEELFEQMAGSLGDGIAHALLEAVTQPEGTRQGQRDFRVKNRDSCFVRIVVSLFLAPA
jgi:Transposase domain (DUF772)